MLPSLKYNADTVMGDPSLMHTAIGQTCSRCIRALLWREGIPICKERCENLWDQSCSQVPPKCNGVELRLEVFLTRCHFLWV